MGMDMALTGIRMPVGMQCTKRASERRVLIRGDDAGITPRATAAWRQERGKADAARPP
jgi:hypothetical protein